MTSLTAQSRIIGVELFSGSGGMSLGATLAGVEVKLAVEINSTTAATYRINHKSTRLINDDVKNIRSIDIKKGKYSTVLFGGPPCQGFSISNRRTRNSSNYKNWQFKQFIRLAKLWKPDWVVIENVSGLIKTEKGLFLEMILEDLKKLGYETSYKILNAVNYGVPQKRERLFIVGSLHGITLDMPSQIHDTVTVNDAIEDLPILENGAINKGLEYSSDSHSEYSKYMRGELSIVMNNGVSKNNDLVISRYNTNSRMRSRTFDKWTIHH